MNLVYFSAYIGVLIIQVYKISDGFYSYKFCGAGNNMFTEKKLKHSYFVLSHLGCGCDKHFSLSLLCLSVGCCLPNYCSLLSIVKRKGNNTSKVCWVFPRWFRKPLNKVRGRALSGSSEPPALSCNLNSCWLYRRLLWKQEGKLGRIRWNFRKSICQIAQHCISE